MRIIYVCAVSYTHLDVYKRQDLNVINTLRTGHMGGLGYMYSCV